MVLSPLIIKKRKVAPIARPLLHFHCLQMNSDLGAAVHNNRIPPVSLETRKAEGFVVGK